MTPTTYQGVLEFLKAGAILNLIFHNSDDGIRAVSCLLSASPQAITIAEGDKRLLTRVVDTHSFAALPGRKLKIQLLAHLDPTHFGAFLISVAYGIYRGLKDISPG